MGDFLVGQEGGIGSNGFANFAANLLSIMKGKSTYYHGDPVSVIYLPVFNNFDADRIAVASLSAQIHWASLFEHILPHTDNGIVFVLQSCTSNYTFEIKGEIVDYVGAGDLHNPSFDYLEKHADFQRVTNVPDSTKNGLSIDHEHCPLRISVYPSEAGFQIVTV